MTTKSTDQELKRRSIFSRIASFFLLEEPQSDSPHVSRKVLVELRQSEWSELFRKPLRDYIRLLHLLRYQLEVKELQQDIPAEYIGRASFLEAGQLKSQEWLQIQSKYVEEKSLLQHEIPLSTAPEQCLTHQDNTLCPFCINFKNQR